MTQTKCFDKVVLVNWAQYSVLSIYSAWRNQTLMLWEAVLSLSTRIVQSQQICNDPDPFQSPFRTRMIYIIQVQIKHISYSMVFFTKVKIWKFPFLWTIEFVSDKLANGLGHRSCSYNDTSTLGSNSTNPAKKNRLAVIGRLFKPWKWKRRKKSERFEKTTKCKFLFYALMILASG